MQLKVLLMQKVGNPNSTNRGAQLPRPTARGVCDPECLVLGQEVL